MNRDNQLIYEGYRQKRYLTPKESLQRDKEFFNYVIESNDHLSSLKKFSTKKLFSSYVSTLANRIDSDNPGLIKESNMSDAEAFGILNEATQTVTDQEAYNGVKDIFEEIAFNNLITKADLFLEQQKVIVKLSKPSADGKTEMLGTPTGVQLPDPNLIQIKLDNNRTAAFPRNQVQQVGPNELQQRQLGGRDKTAQRMQGLRAANQEAAARIAELEAKIQEMEAAEANMNQQQKAQSDSIQDQLAAMIKQIQNTNTAANQNVINIGGPAAAPQSVPAATPQSASTPAASSGQSASTPATSNTQSKPNGQSTSPKPGILSKIGSGIKKALPTLGTIGGAALGSALGPAGTMLGGALGRGLGRFLSPTDPKAGLGQRLKDAGKSALAGGAMGLGGQIGAEMLGNALGGGAGDMSMPADNASSALMNPGEVPSEPGPYADSNPSQPYTPGAVNSGVPGDVAQASNNPYGAAAGTGLPTDSGETQEGDDEPAKRKYKSVDNTKGATRLMRGR